MSRVGRLLRALVGRLRASPFPAPGDVVGDYPAGHEDSSSVHLSQGEPGRPAHSSDGPEQYVPSPEQNDGQAADVPKNFGHYRILTRLGQGGMGVVYKAQDTRLGRFVALKFLSLDASRDKHALERFRVEARAASALNHPNICTVYDIGECDAGTFIAMEFLEGRSLREHLRRGPLAPASLLKLATQLAQGLEAAHSKGIVHRDVKPENLFVVGQDRLKILDFGVAKLQTGRRVLGESELTTRTADLPLTHLGTALGTSAYMSPEQARGEEVDSRSDLFSFGAVLFEMASRRRAFNGRSAAEVFAAVLSQAPALPPTVDPRLRGALQGILDRALEKKREFRYQHASDLAADLKRAERDMGNRHPVTPEPHEAASSRSPVPVGRRMAGDLMKAAALTLVVLLAHSSLEHRSSGKYLSQFQLAFMQENLEHGALDESDFEAGGRHLPVIVDISALHPDKARATDRTLLNVLIEELRKHGARAIGVDLSFDDLQVTDFQYFQKWLTHENVRVGIYQRAVEKREAWLGRPEFATLAAGIALPPDNPQRAFAYSRRWFPAPPRDDSEGIAPTDCVVARDSARCKEDLIQLPVALWLMSEKRRISADDPAANETLETRLGRLLDARQPHSSDRSLPDALEFGTYVIDYSYLKELRRNVIRVPSSGTAAERSNLIVTYLDAHGPSIADRVVLVGDLEDTSDQVCYTQGMKPLPGVLVHGCSLATLNRGMLLERTGTFSPRATWGLSLFLVFVILGLRLMHTMSPVLQEWPYENLEIIVFASLSVAVFFVCRWVARTSGVVWPNVLWVSGALALYPFAEPVLRAFAAAPKIMRALVRPSDGRLRGD